ncbi:MAG: PEP-CTERM sorting domain-containing protein [Verrucomicrobiales bacterium]|nr:PEP-CTERM sorting domain-containing protein [Verrucomicrobiales bacterium]
MNTGTKKNPLVLAFASVALFAAPASATLLIYEPFDYTPTNPVNNGARLGDGSQTGGRGLGTLWQSNTNNNDIAVRDGGLSFTDGGGNALPVAGNAMERVVRQGQAAVSSPITINPTTALTADNTTIWMTFLYEDLGFSGPDFGIGLHSAAMIGNDNQTLSASGFGVGFGINSSGGPARSIATIVYDNSVDFTRQTEATASFDGPGPSDVFLLAMRVDWNPSGTLDEISVYNVTDLTNEPTVALASDTFDFTQAQQDSLTIFNISETQVANVDEIRVATTFAEAVGIPEPSTALLAALGGLLVLRRRKK